MRISAVKLMLFICLVVLAVPSAASVIYVDANVNVYPHQELDGRCWTTAFAKITDAMNAAVAGDEIWVADGKYAERVNITKSGIGLYGGFAGTETQRDQRDWKKNITIVNGFPQMASISLTVYATDCTVDGFVVSNEAGSGIVCGAVATISHNLIINNKTSPSASGGGIFCSASATISDNVIAGNCAPTGGGIYCRGGSPVIFNNRIMGNQAVRGSAIYCDSTCTAAITNNTIVKNTGGSVDYPAIYAYGATMVNNIIAFNSYGIYGDKTKIHHNCVYSNNQDWQNQYDIIADPRIMGVDYRDAHLNAGSPCIDKGWFDTTNLPQTDMDGEARIIGTNVDIGADEYNSSAPSFKPAVVRVSPDGNDANDGSSWALAKKTIQNAADYAAIIGGEVWVKAGTYPENLDLRSYSYIYGGFAGTESSKSERSWKKNISVIDGTPGACTMSPVINVKAGYSDITIDGCKIINGKALKGGGVCLAGEDCTVRNNTITGNTATGNFPMGGGVYCSSVSALIAGNTISGNTVVCTDFPQPVCGGGGIATDAACAATISGNTITGNVVKPTTNAWGSLGGGGIGCFGTYVNKGTTKILNNIISNNVVDGTNNGISCYAYNISIKGNTIKDSPVYTEGYGIVIDKNTLINSGIQCQKGESTITNNLVAGEIYIHDASSSVKRNTVKGGVILGGAGTCDIVGNIIAFGDYGIVKYVQETTLTPSYNCVYGNTYNYSGLPDQTGINGNISADPLFVNRAAGDYHLLSNSPCIDANPNDKLPMQGLDGVVGPLDGNNDQMWIADLGCYEFARDKCSPAQAKMLPNYSHAVISGVITATFGSFMYIQDASGPCGIYVDNVYCSYPITCVPGMQVTVEGKIINRYPERGIRADRINTGDTVPVPQPFYMSLNSLGGGDMGYQKAVVDYRMVKNPVTQVWERKAFTYGGASNNGILVKVTGRVNNPGSNGFYIEDGCNFAPGFTTNYRGVWVSLPYGAQNPANGAYVEVTGISSCTSLTSGVTRQIIAPTADSVRVLR